MNALFNNTTGSNNTALGNGTGGGITTGSGNTILGAQVTGLATALTNNIILANGTGAVKAQHDGTNWTFTGGTTLTGALSGTTFTGTGLVINNNGEALRAYGTSPNVSFYNAANTTRGGYVNHDGTNMNIVADVGVIALGTAMTGTSATFSGNVGINVAADASIPLVISKSLSNNYITRLTNSNATTPYGLDITFSGGTPNDATREFINAADASAVRFTVRSNGGIANYSAYDVNLSDERVKKDIIPLESYWDKFKAIEIVKFKYKDQTHDDFNIGVIAQQVEAVAPELVDIDGWDNKPKLDEEGNEIINDEKPLKSIYTADLYHATIKVLQECMSKIESQQAQIEELKALIKPIEPIVPEVMPEPIIPTDNNLE
jgi:hypothetical protein